MCVCVRSAWRESELTLSSRAAWPLLPPRQAWAQRPDADKTSGHPVLFICLLRRARRRSVQHNVTPSGSIPRAICNVALIFPVFFFFYSGGSETFKRDNCCLCSFCPPPVSGWFVQSMFFALACVSSKKQPGTLIFIIDSQWQIS